MPTRMRGVDLNLFVIFQTLFDTRNTTLAGKQLGMTQSAVSNALRRLRKILNDPLFVRTGEGMMPTPVAELYALQVRKGLAQLNEVVRYRDLFDPVRSDRTFRINMSDLGQKVLLPPLLAFLSATAPGVNVTIVNLDLDLAYHHMENGTIDLSAGFFKSTKPALYQQSLFSEHYVCAMRRGHPAIRPGTGLDLEGFLHSAHAAYRPAAGSHHYIESVIDKVFLEHGVRRRVSVRLASLLGVTQIVANSDLLISIPSRLAQVVQQDRGIRFFPLPFNAPGFDIVQLWHQRSNHDPGHQWLRQSFHQLVHRAAPDDTGPLRASTIA